MNKMSLDFVAVSRIVTISIIPVQYKYLLAAQCVVDRLCCFVLFLVAFAKRATVCFFSRYSVVQSYGDREKIISFFLVQLMASLTGDHNRLVPKLLSMMTATHTRTRSKHEKLQMITVAQ